MNREDKRAAEREARRLERQDTVAPPTPSAPLESGPRERTSPGKFLKEVRTELRKVAWPGRGEVVQYTVVVLAVTTVLTTIVFAMDWVIRNAIINSFG